MNWFKQRQKPLQVVRTEPNWILEWQGQQIAVLSDCFIPDQFWKHFKISICENSLGITAQTLVSEDWWNLHFLEVQYRQADQPNIVMTEVLASPQSESELALRGL